MNIDDTVEDNKGVVKKASVGIIKYLIGYNIHESYKEKREEICIQEKDNPAKRNLKLGLNYFKEGLRESVRYAPLAIELLVLKDFITGDASTSYTLHSALSIRLFEGAFMYINSGYEKQENKKKIKDLLEDRDDMIHSISNMTKRLSRKTEDFSYLLAAWIITDEDKELSAQLDSEEIDPYAVLNVNKNSGSDEIRSSYKSLIGEFDIAKFNFEKLTIGEKKNFVHVVKSYHQIMNDLDTEKLA
ncbi:MAG: hypothetical protein ACP5NV_04305, partial [Candidatus Woesearchaeota archaeon]